MQKEREKFLLFRIYRNRDHKAFSELYAEYHPRIRNYLGFRMPTVHEAEDAAADVFLRAWDYLQTTRVESLSGLLYKMARNLNANFYRDRAQHQEEGLDVAEEIADDTPRADEMLSTELSIEAIKRLLPKLKDEYRDVLLLRFLEEYSIPEIAEAMEKTENNVRVLIFRALKKMRTLITDPEKYT